MELMAMSNEEERKHRAKEVCGAEDSVFGKAGIGSATVIASCSDAGCELHG